MLKCNLAVLLAERKLKISKVATDTGISRTTLTALSSNQSQGIQFDTLNTLCSYLRVTPAEFFCYAPFEVRVEIKVSEPPFFELELSFVNVQDKRLGVAQLSVAVEGSDGVSKDKYGRIILTDKLLIIVSLPEDSVNAAILNRYLKGLSPVFKNDIEQIIGKAIIEQYKHIDADGIFEFEIFWNKEIF